ncbi:MAG: hypothetical protein ACYDH6_09540 [Acidimicrobiales bacterium]
MPPILRSSARGWTAPVLTFIAVAVVAASCGGGGSSKSPAAAPSTTLAGGRNAAALQPFRTCMQAHGVTLPTAPARQGPPPTDTPGASAAPGDTGGGQRRGFGGGGGFGGVGQVINSSDPATKAAFDACKGQLPAGVLDQIVKGQTARQAFVTCMQTHGITVANGGFGGRPDRSTSTTSTTTPEFAAAFKTCSVLLPQRGPNGPGGSPTTTA